MIRYDPFDPAILSNPYSIYALLRDEAPAHRVPDLDLWVLSRNDDVVAALRNPGVFSSAGGMGLLRGAGPEGPLRDFIRSRQPPFGDLSFEEIAELRSLIASDPPEHTRIRKLANRGFAPKDVARLEPRIRKIVDGLVDGLLSKGEEADLVLDLAYPLPVIVIAELLGIPPEQRDTFKRWSDDRVGNLTAGVDFARARESAREMFVYFSRIVEERRRAPGEDLISNFIRADEGEEAFDANELVALCQLLLVAGNETTTNLIANAALAFFDRPALWQRLRQTPALVPSAVEEVLRFDSPVQVLLRSTSRPVTVAGVQIPSNRPVLLLLGSANRDPRHYERPDELLLERNPTDHLGFGAGIHLCLGAPLARLEARVTGETLLRRTQLIEPAGAPTRADNLLFRGLRRLPVRVLPG